MNLEKIGITFFPPLIHLDRPFSLFLIVFYTKMYILRCYHRLLRLLSKPTGLNTGQKNLAKLDSLGRFLKPLVSKQARNSAGKNLLVWCDGFVASPKSPFNRVKV